jgi:hypothetical protein
MDTLRERAGSSRRRVDKADDDVPWPSSRASGSLPTTTGHINFFEDLEHVRLLHFSSNSPCLNPSLHSNQ